MVVSGIPPAVYVQVIIRCITAKAGAWGTSVPHVFLLNFESILFFSRNSPVYPLKAPLKWFIIPGSMHKAAGFVRKTLGQMRGYDYMSASSKKKLRSEERAAKLTERQLEAQKEAKKVALMTRLFTAVLAVIVVVALIVGTGNIISASGIREKNTVALTVGNHEISNAEMNYFFVDAVNNFTQTYGSYASMFGLDMTKPLNEQFVDEEAGTTWADDFMTTATDTAKSIYAMYDAAMAAGHTLTEAELATLEGNLSNMKAYGLIYGYQNMTDYLKAMYGNGSTEKSFRTYMETNMLAQSYYNAYIAGLTYDDAALRAADAEDPAAYNAYSYNYYNVNVSKFMTGGTEDENGNVTYTDEERDAAVKAAEEAANALTAEEIETVEDLDAAIAAMEVNAESENAASTVMTDVAKASVMGVMRDWVTDPARKVGDITVIENANTTTAEDGTESKIVSGYYVVMFTGMNDNTFGLKNVRHILVKFQGGAYDATTGVTTYNEQERASAKLKAEELLSDWKSGKASEATFAEMANANSDDGDGTTGGLYENIYPGQMVTAFNDWCFDEIRKPGDTDIIETEYGYHVMYFVGDSETTYRDYQIEKVLRSQDSEAWYNGLIEAITVTEGNTQYVSTDLVLSK